MRRKDREVTDPAKIREILEKGKIIHLGIPDGEFPYVLPMHYGVEVQGEKTVFYLHGAKEGHKLDALRQCGNVGFAIDCEVVPVSGGDIPCKYGAAYASVIGKAHARILEEPEEKIHGLNVLMQTQTGRAFAMTAEMAEAVAVIRLDVLSLTAKRREK